MPSPDVPVGRPFPVWYDMGATVGGGSMIDLTDPGKLSFDLPDGYSITSESGFNSVPEPGTLSLLAAGAVLAALVRRRSK